MNNEAWDLLDEKFWKFPFCCKTGAALRSTQGLQPVYKAVGEKAVVTKSGPNSPFPLFSTGQAASCQSLYFFWVKMWFKYHSAINHQKRL